MSKNSTPGVSAPSTDSAPKHCKDTSTPAEATLARLRQFARAYMAPIQGFPGVVLN